MWIQLRPVQSLAFPIEELNVSDIPESISRSREMVGPVVTVSKAETLERYFGDLPKMA